MKTFFLSLLLLLSQLAAQGKKYARPALVATDELKQFSNLSEARQKIIRAALKGAKAGRAKKYLFGGQNPKRGFDCSGAMYFTLRACGYQPPRTSAAQFIWLRDAENITRVSDEWPNSTTPFSTV